MPAVTVLCSARGDPRASTHSPTRSPCAVPSSATGSGLPDSIFTTARSVDLWAHSIAQSDQALRQILNPALPCKHTVPDMQGYSATDNAEQLHVQIWHSLWQLQLAPIFSPVQVHNAALEGTAVLQGDCHRPSSPQRLAWWAPGVQQILQDVCIGDEGAVCVDYEAGGSLAPLHTHLMSAIFCRHRGLEHLRFTGCPDDDAAFTLHGTETYGGFEGMQQRGRTGCLLDGWADTLTTAGAALAAASAMKLGPRPKPPAGPAWGAAIGGSAEIPVVGHPTVVCSPAGTSNDSGWYS